MGWKLAAPVVAAVMVLAPGPRADAGSNAVGVNTHIPAPAVIDLVVDLGAKWIRVDNNWFQQTDPCSTSIGWFAPLDTAVSYAVGHNLNVYMTLAYTPACASLGNGDGMTNNNDVPDATAYKSYVRQAVAHYRAMGVTHFGLWNEPNLGGFFEGNPAQYVANIVTPGIAAIDLGCGDAGHSDCKALGPDLAHVGDYDVFLEDTLNAMNGAGLSFDILAHHIYQGFDTPVWDGDSFLNALEMRRFSFTRRSLIDVLTDTGLASGGVPSIDIWITETGYHANPPTDSAEMATQADYYMSVIDTQLDRAWYTNSFFYEILDSGDELDGFGITRNDGAGGFTLKPAYLALQNRIASEPLLNGSSGGDPDAGPGSADAGTSGSPDAGPGNSNDGGAGNPGNDAGAGDDSPSGGCQLGDTNAAGGLALLLLGLLLAVRRRAVS